MNEEYWFSKQREYSVGRVEVLLSGQPLAAVAEPAPCSVGL